MLSCFWILLIFGLNSSPTTAPPIVLPCWDCPPRKVPVCPPPDPKVNYRPIIGILSHPGDGASGRLNNATNASYIAASYVKFVESGGARVIPLIYNEPPEILHKLIAFLKFMFAAFSVIYTGCDFHSSIACMHGIAPLQIAKH
ncbi:UNVERIFIED_CONTAM: Gamma-glutamyl hydrolase 1 [Sesamum radiatum]|uniref:Gamma-glutamyl hydrolase 1 n=1 Tax=Sesamum radiatum TaxID=300843 RepID=A0AAW2T709_SESRA